MFSAGECTERGSRIKPLRFDRRAARPERAGLTRLLSAPVLLPLGKNVIEKWEPGRSAKGRVRKDTIPCAFGVTKSALPERARRPVLGVPEMTL